MGVVTNAPSFFTARVSNYVPAMDYAADVNIDGLTKISFGSPAAASATAILNAQSIATAGTSTTFAGVNAPYQLDARFGRGISIVLSGAGAPTVTIRGRDFWGQRVSETMTGNGTTPVLSVKTYKWIDSITWTLIGGTTMNVGTNTTLGLPYKAVKVISEELADVPQGTLGTLTAAVLTDPQTATTGDPRGRYVANATLNGTELTASFIFSNWKNAAGNGGLMGIRHVFS